MRNLFDLSRSEDVQKLSSDILTVVTVPLFAANQAPFLSFFQILSDVLGLPQVVDYLVNAPVSVLAGLATAFLRVPDVGFCCSLWKRSLTVTPTVRSLIYSILGTITGFMSPDNRAEVLHEFFALPNFESDQLGLLQRLGAMLHSTQPPRGGRAS
jgi:hypothetical protein